MTDPHIDIHPARLGGVPCLSGTRLPVQQVAEMWWAGYELDAVTRAWECLDAAAIKLCYWFWWRRHGPFEPR